MDSLDEVLNKIQCQLKAPKKNYNAFGKYNYRNLEDICEAIKPLIENTGATLCFDDSVENIGDRFYIKATATLSFKGNSISCSSFAREQQNKKGMDESQITGAASSYARKYALNALFLIDDTKDADTSNNVEVNKSEIIITPNNKRLWDRAKDAYKRDNSFDAILKHAHISKENQELIINECA